MNDDIEEKTQSVYAKSLDSFLEYGQQIDGVYDLLVRGTSKDSKKCIPNWSDIDLTIIVEAITPTVLHQIRRLYQKMKAEYSFKISITTVSASDFFSKRHHHGIKPLYYSSLLEHSISLLGKGIKTHRPLDEEELKYECVANLAYLIHDLRICDMKRGEDLVSIREFCCHLLKRAKHLVRNAIFILSGHMSYEIDIDRFREFFFELDDQFPNKLKAFRSNWNDIFNDEEQLVKIVDYVFSTIEKIYEITLSFSENRILTLETTEAFS